MDKRTLLITAGLLVVAMLAMGCAALPGATAKQKPLVGELPCTVIEISSEQFDALNKGDFAQWYTDHSQVEGIHSFTIGEDRYLLLSVGEKPTGGYSLANLTLTGSEDRITADARLQTPKLGDMVAQVLTYPHLLVQIPADAREAVLGSIEGHSLGPEDIRTDSGRYVGQIDNNSIEIKISGVPDAIAARAFRLSAELRADFDALKLKTNDEVLFRYIPKEGEQPIIIEMVKMH